MPRRLSLLPLLLLIVFGLAGCASVESLLGATDRPTARVTETRIVDLTLEGVTLDFDVAIDNPMSLPVPLVNLDYALGSGGHTIGSGQANLSGTVPAGGTRTVTVPASFKFSDVMNVLGSVRPGDVLPYTIDAGLSTEVPGLGAISLPLRREGEVPVPAAPRVSVTSIDWTRLGLNEAAAMMNVKIMNPNAFGLDLDGLDYGLALGGREVVRTDVRTPASFGPGDEGTLELPITFRPLDLGVAIMNLLTGSGAPYRLAGSMSVGTPFGPLDLPFEQAGETIFNR